MNSEMLAAEAGEFFRLASVQALSGEFYRPRRRGQDAAQD